VCHSPNAICHKRVLILFVRKSRANMLMKSPPGFLKNSVNIVEVVYNDHSYNEIVAKFSEQLLYNCCYGPKWTITAITMLQLHQTNTDNLIQFVITDFDCCTIIRTLALRQRVDFTNMLTPSFYKQRSQKRQKRHSSCQCLFELLGSSQIIGSVTVKTFTTKILP